MFGTRKAPKRFSLLLLEEGEDYVEDWVAEARWPSNVSGNWQGLPKLPGRLRLCSKSIFFEPDDVRNPIVRCYLMLSSASLSLDCMLHAPAPKTLPVHCLMYMI